MPATMCKLVKARSCGAVPHVSPVPLGSRPVGNFKPMRHNLDLTQRSKDYATFAVAMLVAAIGISHAGLTLATLGQSPTEAATASPTCGQQLSADVSGVDGSLIDAPRLEAIAKRLLDGGAGWSPLSGADGPEELLFGAASANGHAFLRYRPADGSALVDLYTKSATRSRIVQELVPYLTTSAAFGSESTVEWTMSARGRNCRAEDDSEALQWKWSHEKTLVVDEQSEFQRIEVWEYNEPGVDYREGRGRNRVLLLDGVTQVDTEDEATYHESLVHPGLLAHPTGARRVLVLGGGDGGAIREVLKHRSVEEVVLVELDPAVIANARRHLPSLSSCRKGDGDGWGSASCFDDPRVTVATSGALEWFAATFGEDACSSINDELLFDAVIMDLLDFGDAWDDTSAFAQELYSTSFIRQLWCALKGDGVFVAQLGAVPDPSTVLSSSKLEMTESFQRVFVEKHSEVNASDPRRGDLPDGLITSVYATYVPSFVDEWSFAVQCKSGVCGQRWHGNSARTNLAIRQRLLPAARPLSYYDGSIQQAFQQVPRRWQDLFCLQPGNARFCNDGWLSRETVFDGAEELSEALSVIANAELGGSAAIAARDLNAETYLGLFDASTAFKISDQDFEMLREFAAATGSEEYRGIVSWIDKFAWRCTTQGGHWHVSLLSKATFVNHGCAGVPGLEVNLGSGVADAVGEPAWNPVYMRNAAEECTETKTLRPIARGEALMQDYTTFELDEDDDAEANGWCESARAALAEPAPAAAVAGGLVATQVAEALGTAAAEAAAATETNSSFARFGVHVVIEASHAPFDAINSSGPVREAMVAAAADGAFNIVAERFFDFPVMGSSGVLVLSQSHFSVHTWPEEGYAALDVFTCSNFDTPPCGRSSAMEYLGGGAWGCEDGATADMDSAVGIWATAASIVSRLGAGRALVRWAERGDHHVGV